MIIIYQSSTTLFILVPQHDTWDIMAVFQNPPFTWRGDGRPLSALSTIQTKPEVHSTVGKDKDKFDNKLLDGTG
jgi:hypothetical protein